MRSIKSVKEMPGWYLLKNYEAALNFTLAEWYHAFALRHLMVKLIGRANPDGEIGAIWHCLEQHINGFSLKEIWEALRDHGAMAHANFFKGAHHFPLSGSSVTSLSISDLFSITNNFKVPDEHDLTEFKPVESRSPIDDSQNQVHADSNAHDAIGNSHYWLESVAFAQVDLMASDATIESNFRSWLRKIRSDHEYAVIKRVRQYSSKDAMKWSNCGVLPYLDLSIWATLEGIEISDWIYGETVLHPDRMINASESIRKTTAPLAARIRSYELPGSLRSDLSGRGSEG